MTARRVFLFLFALAFAACFVLVLLDDAAGTPAPTTVTEAPR